MQARGSLDDTNVRSLLEAAQSERATGTLTVRQNGDHPTTLYFLFGHLFHAVGNGLAGDDAVLRALGCRNGEFDFDAKAKLPADESVKSSIGDLVTRGSPRPGPNGPPQANNLPRPIPPPPRPSANSVPPALGPRPPEPQAQPPPQPPPQVWMPDPRPQVLPASLPHPAQPPAAFPAHSQPAAPQFPPPPSPAVPRPVPNLQRELTPAAVSRGLKYRPLPPRGRDPIPVPAGQVMYDSLKTSFVDFPRLITTLQREGYTGYVRLLTQDSSGLLYFRQGSVLESVFDTGQDPMETGRTAIQRFEQEVSLGHGVLDVVGLPEELVTGLYELTVAQPIYAELYAGWVELGAFLAFLQERKLSGSLMVRATAGTGVILFDEGQLRGAYTSEQREVTGRADAVLALCRDPNAMIEVKAAPETNPQPLSVEDLLGGARGGPANPPAWWQAASRPVPEAPAPVPLAPPASPAAGPEPTLTPLAPPPPIPEQPPVERGPDWDAIVAELQQMAEESLGNRSRKVRDLLGSAERSQQGIERAIDQVPGVSILFVDASRLEALANDLRARLYSYLG